MADVLARSGIVGFAICESRGGVDGRRFLSGSRFGRSRESVESLRFSSGCNFFGTALMETNWAKIPKTARLATAVPVQMTLSIGKAMKWWEKGIQPNMKEVTSAEDLVVSLNNAGNQLVIVDFFSPGCAGCRALHPKICQFAEMNPDVLFLQINHEKHKSMCYSLNVHVLPFFRFYRGAQGRLCSFSCTNATIKKFKDALAKHGTERCSLGPAKGLEEAELMALSANKDLSFTYAGESEVKPEPVTGPALEPTPLSPPAPKPSEKAPVTAWR